MKTLNFQKLNITGADVLTRLQMKKIVGGHSWGTCTSTCWINVTEELGSVEVPNCEGENAGACKEHYPEATKASCSCGG